MFLTESNLAGLDISELMNRFTKIMSENSIIMPEGVYLLAKGFAQIEGIGRYLYPELDIAAVLLNLMLHKCSRNDFHLNA